MMKIILKLSDLVSSNAVETLNVNVYSIKKKLTTGFPVAKTLIECNNSLEENDEEEKPINIELTDQNQILIMMKMLFTLNDQV